MTDPKLPVAKKENLPEGIQSSAMETIKSIRINRALLVVGLVASASAVGVFVLTQYTILSAFLAISGAVFFGARQLVKKSLALTSNTNQLLLGSTLHKLEQIKKQVSKCKFLENVETEGTQAANQADLLLQQYKSLKNILTQKFDPSEITFGRYLSSIDTSCLSIGENLVHTKSILENLNLVSKSNFDQAQEQKKQVLLLLNSTDEALQQLATLFNSVNEINTKEKHRDQLEQSMQQIRELADRAKIYSKH